MRRFIRILLVAAAVCSQAQIPQTISYQGFLTDGSGKTAPDGSVKMTFRLYASESGGAGIWEETQDAVEVAGGVFSVYLGSVNPLKLRFDGPSWLGVSVGGQSELVPRMKLAAVPYAFHAANADTALALKNGGAAGTQIIPPLILNAQTAGPMLNVNQRGTGPAGLFEIQNSASTDTALLVRTDGKGPALKAFSNGTGGNAGFLRITNATNNSDALLVQTKGSGRGALFSIMNDTNPNTVLWAYTSGPGTAVLFGISAASTADIIQGNKGDTQKFRVDHNGTFHAGSDFAVGVYPQTVPSTLEPGDVLVIAAGKEKVAGCSEANSVKVCGVYSTQPGFMGSFNENGRKANPVPMAVTGVVTCKVTNDNGDIQPGDLLVTSARAGHAMKAPAGPAPGTLLGKAMDSCLIGSKKISVLVTLN
jgi:hypothetical protein